MIDFAPMIAEVYKVVPWIILALIVVAFFKSPWFKGWLGEWMVNVVANLRLDPKVYRRLHNVTLPAEDGTTQIDHVIVSPYGIFVIETKNMKGWIFGGEKQAQWTQKLYRKTIKFQNPLRQNYKHVKALEAALDVPAECIHSVVVFAGESTFRTPMPSNVTQGGGFVRYIQSVQNAVMTPGEVDALVARIETGRLAPTRATHKAHVAQLQERRTKTSRSPVEVPVVEPTLVVPGPLASDTQRTCPKCSRPLVHRVAKRGPNAGGAFWGCEGFPECRFTKAE